MDYGDVLKYRVDDPADIARFMFMDNRPGYIEVMVLRTWEDDDLWAPGYILNAGINELIPAEDE